MQIEFINHASVLITEGDVALLTDPWYSGPAFHKGWKLLVETPDAEVDALLDRVTHIWLSHEHPDHFSIGFFKTHGAKLRARNIPILFQNINDQRVAQFIRAQGIELREMTFGKPYDIGGMALMCLKDDWYDSLVSIKTATHHILNLNDCHVDDEKRARQILDQAGPCDVLLTQFSYAGWKGGPENQSWREEAAAGKLDNIEVQARLLKPRVVIPFASFVSFANVRNVYLNDAANGPQDVLDRFADADFAIQVMQPGDTFAGEVNEAHSKAAVAFWEDAAARAQNGPLMEFTSRTPEDLQAVFQTFITRVQANNNVTAMRLAQKFSPIRVFQPVVVECDDLGLSYEIDVAQGQFTETTKPSHLAMHSESLWFLFQNTFGFDTLTVNGCLTEMQEGGFSRAAKSISIETLNNLSIRFGPGLMFEPRLIAVTLSRIVAASRNLRGGA
ncbi:MULTISPECIES: MBL fold metallo-hydrolase [unclassified Marinovum]